MIGSLEKETFRYLNYSLIQHWINSPFAGGKAREHEPGGPGYVPALSLSSPGAYLGLRVLICKGSLLLYMLFSMLN